MFYFNNFEIDLGRQEMRCAGSRVHMEPQVFDLLVHLVRNRDRIVSKDELIETVWNGRIVSEAALSSRVSAARRALGDSGNSQAMIRTLHKRGFRFVGEVEETAAANPCADDTVTHTPAPMMADNNAAQLSSHAEAPPSAKPSIAVLPFQNMSVDPDQEYFADGLTEDIITGLARQRWFSVISRNSTFGYRSRSEDVRDVAAQLGVRYVLDGSVRRANNRVRVNVQLIDATDGSQMWADRYDRQLDDIFTLQDEVTNRVIASVAPQIMVTEAERVTRSKPQSIGAWELVMRAVPHMWRMNVQDNARAQELLRQAIDREPNYAHAHALLGWTYVTMYNLDTRRPIGESTEQLLVTGARAVMLDDADPWGHLVLGLGHARKRRPELAIRHLTKSVQLSPSLALGHAGLGYAFACGGHPEGGLVALEVAQRLSPRDPFLAIYAPVVRYMALFALQQYEETIAVCRSTLALHPHHAGAWRLMTVSLGLLGRLDEAAEALASTRALQPDLSSAHVANDTVYANAEDRTRYLEGLRKAGLKD